MKFAFVGLMSRMVVIWAIQEIDRLINYDL